MGGGCDMMVHGDRSPGFLAWKDWFIFRRRTLAYWGGRLHPLAQIRAVFTGLSSRDSTCFSSPSRLL